MYCANGAGSVRKSGVSKPVSPSIHETAFNCPHCSVLTTQYWYDLLANACKDETGLPVVVSASQRKIIADSPGTTTEEKKSLLSYVDKMLTGLVYIGKEGGKYGDHPISNLHLSKCYNCKKVAVWVFDRLVFPRKKNGVSPNRDLPESIRVDFEEAREIVDASPRGAAALLRDCASKNYANIWANLARISTLILVLLLRRALIHWYNGLLILCELSGMKPFIRE